jgi:mxaJ protein
MRIILLVLCLTCCASSTALALVVCADPNDLPFSNRAGQGFENKIVELLAKDMDTEVTYMWWPQRRGFVRKTLNAAKCDMWPGVVSGLETVTVSHSYYRSTYVFVSRKSSALQNLTLDDPRLKQRLIGVQMIGNDATNTPPAHAIASRGITDNVRGFMLVGDYGRPNPKAAIIDALADGTIDVALVWGPLAGYLAKGSPVPLRIEPVTPANDARWPMAFDISLAVRRGDVDLRDKLNAALERKKAAVDAILRSYGVPLADNSASIAMHLAIEMLAGGCA